jgi:hypothetical protein
VAYNAPGVQAKEAMDTREFTKLVKDEGLGDFAAVAQRIEAGDKRLETFLFAPANFLRQHQLFAAAQQYNSAVAQPVMPANVITALCSYAGEMDCVCKPKGSFFCAYFGVNALNGLPAGAGQLCTLSCMTAGRGKPTADRKKTLLVHGPSGTGI